MLEKQLISTETNYLPEIFHGQVQPVIESLSVTHKAPDQWTDFVAHLAQFNQYDVKSTRNELEALLNLQGLSQQAVLHAGIARCYLGEGQLLKSVQHLGYAYRLAENTTPDSQAFIMLEMVNIMTLVGNREQSILLLNSCKSLAESDYLKHIAYYYENVNRARNGNFTVVNQLIKSREYFADNGQYATLAYHYKNIGNIYGKQKRYDEAVGEYAAGLAICNEQNYTHIHDAISHDMGMMEFRQGNTDKALKILASVSENAGSFYTRCYSLGNMGFIYSKNQDFKNTEIYFTQALNIATDHGVFHLIPGICYHLGKANIELGKPKNAAVYFYQGAQASLELAQNKFPLNGEKLKVIEESLKYTDNDSNPVQKEKYDYSFAVDRSMKEIRATFQNAALNEILNQTGSVKNAVNKLNISDSTFSKAMNRSDEHKLDATPCCIKEFILQNDGKTWKEMNAEFEKYILSFLLGEYGHNKKILSEKLDVNYSRLVSKMNQVSA